MKGKGAAGGDGVNAGTNWMAGIPKHWTIKKLSYLASLRSGEAITSEQIEEQGAFPVFGGNGLRGYTDAFTHRGHNVLIGRQGALCGNVNYADGEFWASEHAVVVSPLEECEVRWLGELLRSMNLNQHSVSPAQPGLSVETICALKIPIPPLAEQRSIARYLDAEITQMDALVAEKERMLALLEEQWAALVSHAVTRGLNSRAKLKPSGLCWLGDIPALGGQTTEALRHNRKRFHAKPRKAGLLGRRGLSVAK